MNTIDLLTKSQIARMRASDLLEVLSFSGIDVTVAKTMSRVELSQFATTAQKRYVDAKAAPAVQEAEIVTKIVEYCISIGEEVSEEDVTTIINNYFDAGVFASKLEAAEAVYYDVTTSQTTTSQDAVLFRHANHIVVMPSTSEQPAAEITIVVDDTHTDLHQYATRLSAGEKKSALARIMWANGIRPRDIATTLNMHPSHVQTALKAIRKKGKEC